MIFQKVKKSWKGTTASQRISKSFKMLLLEISTLGNLEFVVAKFVGNWKSKPQDTNETMPVFPIKTGGNSVKKIRHSKSIDSTQYRILLDNEISLF